VAGLRFSKVSPDLASTSAWSIQSFFGEGRGACGASIMGPIVAGALRRGKRRRQPRLRRGGPR
jgi:hypothetical protein